MRRSATHWISLLIATTVLVPGCARAVVLPPGSAGPEAVLDAYLQTLVAGDCETGQRLTLPTFRNGNGELCGAIDVTAYRIERSTPPGREEIVFSTTLTTTGDGGRSIDPGDMLWFYSLLRQPDGTWRIAGGGTGP